MSKEVKPPGDRAKVAPEIRRIQERVHEDSLGTLKLVDVNELQMPSWKQLITLLGFPIEEEDFPASSTPLIGLVFISLCIAYYFASWETQLSLALDRETPFRYFGFNFLSHSVVHSGFLHLSINLLFVSPFIDATEEDLGSFNFFKLIGLAALASGLAQYLFVPGQYLLMGASGVFLAIATYYCLRFPQRRFLITLPFIGIIAYTKRLRLRAWLLILGYLIIEVVALKSQLMGLTNTSHLSHIGGIVTGALFYYFHNKEEIV